MAYEGQAVVSDANALSSGEGQEPANEEPAIQAPTNKDDRADVALSDGQAGADGHGLASLGAGYAGPATPGLEGRALEDPGLGIARLEPNPILEGLGLGGSSLGGPSFGNPRFDGPGLGGPGFGDPSFGNPSLGSAGEGMLGGGPTTFGNATITNAKPLELPTANLTELAQLLALAIAQNQAARSLPAPTNSELTSLATLVSNAGAQRTLAPVFKDGLSALSYSRPATRPIPSLPALQDVGPDDEEPMPIPSTWRQPPPRDDEGWFHQQMGAALLGLVAGLVIVVPSVLWMSGWLEGAKTQGLSRTAAASVEPRASEVRTVKVQVRPLEKPIETAAQFVAGNVEARHVASSGRPIESSAVEASAAEAREAEARDAEAREAEARQAQAREAAAREAAAREARAREAEAKAAEARAAEAREAEARRAEARAAEARAAEARAAEARAAEARAAEARAAEAKAAGARAAAVKVAELHARQDSLLGKARQRVESGDIGGAREILTAGDDGAQGPVLFALAETYDPNMLAAWGSRGVTADVARAKSLYQKALGLGVANARGRIDALQ